MALIGLMGILCMVHVEAKKGNTETDLYWCRML